MFLKASQAVISCNSRPWEAATGESLGLLAQEVQANQEAQDPSGRHWLQKNEQRDSQKNNN